jgi:hypothetical protein
MIDYGSHGERQDHIWIMMLSPAKRTSLPELLQSDKRAAENIARLQSMIDDLQQYRRDMAERAAYLLTAQPVRSAELKRDARSKKIYYDFIEWDTYPDGTRQRVSVKTYDGTDRHKAIADAKAYQRTHTGIAVTVDIAKGKFEH